MLRNNKRLRLLNNGSAEQVRKSEPERGREREREDETSGEQQVQVQRVEKARFMFEAGTKFVCV